MRRSIVEWARRNARQVRSCSSLSLVGSWPWQVVSHTIVDKATYIWYIVATTTVVICIKRSFMMSTATRSHDRSRQAPGPSTTVHSSATFEVEHAGVSVFRGGFRPIDAKLVVRRRRPRARGRRRGRSITSTTRTSGRTCSRRSSSTSSATRRSASARPRSAAMPTTCRSRASSRWPASRCRSRRGRLRGPVAVPGGGRAAVARARGHDRPHRLRDELADGPPRRRHGARQRRQAHRRAGAEQEG